VQRFIATPKMNKQNIFRFEDTFFSSVITQPAIILLVWPLVLVFAILRLIWYWNVGRVRRSSKQQVYAFFHPYCSGGGGGERVLWKIVQSLQQTKKNVKIVIFTVDPPGTDEKNIREDAQRQFDVTIPHPVHLVSLEDCRHYLNPRPFLSLVMESWGTMQLAYEAFQRYEQQTSPDNNAPIDVYWDTTGCAFTFLVARWMCPSAWIVAYVHYPTISTDMMAWEWQQNTKTRPMHKTLLKLVYYWWFAIMYGLVGSLADLVMVNSTWTYGHIQRLWGFFSSQRIHIVYPPCRVPSSTSTPTTPQESSSSSYSSSPKDRTRTIVSIGQFRPEKDHALQVKSLALLFEKYPQHKQEDVKLLLIGSCRNDQDQQRVDTLRKLVSQKQLEESVTFSINPPYKELQESMNSALIGIHTMRQEHFGIGIVEMMAAGLIVVAHGSGGPKTDIVNHQVTGYLATNADEYAEALHQALTLPSQEARILREEARASATRFSDETFDDALPVVLSKLTGSSL
jgi:alpha-1,2-mannosyltransferase